MESSDIPHHPRNLRVEITREGKFITFFDIKGIVDFEFIPQDQTVNKAYCVEILKWLHETVLRERPEVRPNDWILHHDNVTAQKTLFVE
jgi:hypothetical protein